MRGEKCCCSVKDGSIPEASTALSFKDILGACKIRLGIDRMNYRVEPGLYSVGRPDGGSPVLVSANYKLTVDAVRKNLDGLNCWLLILDTKGVNVWCAAGKGTFGTEELVKRIEAVKLSEVVNHRELILPQLGAPGVAANEVTGRTGFSVIYGPVRSADIQAFISAGNKATEEMRLIKFTFTDRLVLTPMEIVPAVKKSLQVFSVLFLTNLFAKRPFTKHDVAAYIGAVFVGSVITPLLLPYIPGKAFSIKGWQLGFGWTAAYLVLTKGFAESNRFLSAGKLFLLPCVSSYHALNFTGSSTYTSHSGVKKEIEQILPFMAGIAAIGAAFLLFAHLFGIGAKSK